MGTARQSAEMRDVAPLIPAPSLVQRSRRLSLRVYRGSSAMVAVLTFALAAGALAFADAAVVGWWPAVGTAAVLWLMYRGPRWQVALLTAMAVGAASLLVLRDPWSAVAVTATTVVSVVVFVLALGPRGPAAVLSQSRGYVRFLLAAGAASVAAGAVDAAISLLVVATVLWTNTALLVMSYLSALALIAPIALIPLPCGVPRHRSEIVAQASVVVGLSMWVIVSAEPLTFSFVLFPALVWAALRLCPVVATLELLLVGVIFSGVAAFAVDPASMAVLVMHLYVVSLAITTHVTIVVSHVRVRSRSELARRAALLRATPLRSGVGTIVVKPDPTDGVSIVDMNDVATTIVDEEWFRTLLVSWFDTDADEFSTEIDLADNRTIQAHGQLLLTEDGDSVLVVQLIDVTSFIEAHRVLAQAIARDREVIDKLHALSKQKDDFVSSVSHELRTPITSIVGFAEELDDSATDTQRVATTIIMRNALRLSDMVEELLELGRMTAPNPVRERDSVDVSSIARDAHAEQARSAADREVTIETSLAETGALVLSSKNSLARVATNLLSNAIKFTPVGGTVRITVTVDDDRVILEIEDSGPGISAVDESRVFERFYRSDDPERRKTPGTGLGLSIVKSLVEFMDGEVTIGRSLLGGARMTVLLPKAPDYPE